MYVSVNIWFLCFVIAAVCCIHVCSVTGEISQRKRRRRVKTTELKQLFSKNYLNSPGGFKVRPGFALFIPAQSGRIETSRIAFYVQRARLNGILFNFKENTIGKTANFYPNLIPKVGVSLQMPCTIIPASKIGSGSMRATG